MYLYRYISECMYACICFSTFKHFGWTWHNFIFYLLYLTDILLMPYSILCAKSENKGDLRGVGVEVREKKY